MYKGVQKRGRQAFRVLDKSFAAQIADFLADPARVAKRHKPSVDVAHMRCWDGCHVWSPDLGNPCAEQGHGPLSHAHTTREACGREQGLYGPSAIGTEPSDAFGRTNGEQQQHCSRSSDSRGKASSNTSLEPRECGNTSLHNHSPIKLA